jgi:Putative rhamnosyl transferase/Polysaccharide pyruvyl transferase
MTSATFGLAPKALKHFIVIRLGLGVYSPAWYDDRLALFEAITCPSLRAQTDQAFIVLIVVDQQIPRPVLSRLRDIIANAPHLHIVELDLTNLRQVRHGSWDFVWDHCQDYIIEQNLLDDPFEYVITSILDDDDAWHRRTVELIHNQMAPELPRLIAEESRSLTNYRHTRGQVLTFPRGLKWFVHTDVVQPFHYEFLGISVFVLARFSSGVSALSSRHPAWPAMAQVAVFDVKRVEHDQPMWVYVRHDQAETLWQDPTANRPQQATDRGIAGQVGDSVSLQTLRAEFGIDFAKIETWRARRRGAPPTEHAGFPAREQLDCFFRISALNRQIAALDRKQQRNGINAKDEMMLLKQQRARLKLVRQLRKQGSELLATRRQIPSGLSQQEVPRAAAVGGASARSSATDDPEDTGATTKFALLSYSTTNLGDEIQSIAAQQFLPHTDLLIDRDTWTTNAGSFRGAPKIILNGWFSNNPENWPPPAFLSPCLISMHITHERRRPALSNPASEVLVQGESLEYLKRHQPVGCRDYWTLDLLRERGVECYFSGCVTLTLGAADPGRRRDYICAVDLPNDLYPTLAERARSPILRLSHRDTNGGTFEQRCATASRLLNLYAHAKYVVTTRLHCALPCLAFEIPVLLIRAATDQYRFGGLIDFARNCSVESFRDNTVEFDFEKPAPNGGAHYTVRQALIARLESFTGVPFRPYSPVPPREIDAFPEVAEA